MLYINGVDVTGTVTDATIAATAVDLSLARDVDAAFYLDGAMDEVAIYPTALSLARVREHYRAGMEAQLQLANALPYMQLPRGIAAPRP